MSSLFSTSKQQEFIALTAKAAPTMKRELITSTYKTIRTNSNVQWKSYEAAMNCLERKCKFNHTMKTFQNIIKNRATNTLKERQNARTSLSKLIINATSSKLHRELERGFSLTLGTLTPKHNFPKKTTKKLNKRSKSAVPLSFRNKSTKPSKPRLKSSNSNKNTTQNKPNAKLKEAPQKKPISLQKRNVHDDDINSSSDSDSDSFNEEEEKRKELEFDRKQKEINLEKEKILSKMHKNKKLNQRSKSVIGSKAMYKGAFDIPSSGTKEYLQLLLERAISNKAWSDNDAERLCKSAVQLNCDWITVHSMWVKICNELLLKYTQDNYQNDLKKYKKSKRRGSKINFDLNFIQKDESELSVHTKICVTVGYPLGSTSSVSKVAEARQAVIDGAKRIRLMVSAGKVVMNDWDYIIAEVKMVVNAAKGADVRIVFPDTPMITAHVKHDFNERIIKGMSNMKQNKKPKPKPKRATLKYEFSSDDESESEYKSSPDDDDKHIDDDKEQKNDLNQEDKEEEEEEVKEEVKVNDSINPSKSNAFSINPNEIDGDQLETNKDSNLTIDQSATSTAFFDNIEVTDDENNKSLKKKKKKRRRKKKSADDKDDDVLGDEDDGKQRKKRKKRRKKKKSGKDENDELNDNKSRRKKKKRRKKKINKNNTDDVEIEKREQVLPKPPIQLMQQHSDIIRPKLVLNTRKSEKKKLSFKQRRFSVGRISGKFKSLF